MVGRGDNRHMGHDPAVDAYLAAQPEPHRSTLQAVRDTLHRLVPGLTEGMSYGAPAFLLDGRRLAGLVGYARHLSYLPHSGSVIGALGGELAGYSTSKGALKFAVDEPLPEAIVQKLLDARRAELDEDPAGR